MPVSNPELVTLLESVATALSIKKEKNAIFQIRAYENAASAIEHSTSDVHDLWAEGRLGEIPGIGENLKKYLDEYFKTGKVSHFETLMKGIPEVVFELIKIPGVGPKTAQELASLKVKSISDLKQQIKSGELVKNGFSAKAVQKIMLGIQEMETLKTGRMLLPIASIYASQILEYLKKSPDVVDADPLGSLRRQVATVGDLDFAASSKHPEKVIEYFTKMPEILQVVSEGEHKVMVVLKNGLHVDLLVGEPESYGALLQHFTGSKQHNIHLRTYAEDHGLSLSERGVKNIKTGKVVPTKTEKEFYNLLKMDVPEPEIREDGGEIEAGIAHKLPKLVQIEDIKGDLHLHSAFPIEKPSHAPGADSLEDIVEYAKKLGYEYVGISDHSPSPNMPKEAILATIQKRTEAIERLKSTKSIRVLNGLEIDILPDGTLSVPNEALKTLDYCIAGVHSSHKMGKEDMTKRILAALESPYVDIISHPTGRLLNERDSFDADWEAIFKAAAKNKKLLEINAFPNRLDLRDDLIKMALTFGVKFIIDTDAHEKSFMQNMGFGVAVAKRGWATKKDVVNTWNWQDFAKWFEIE